MDQRRQRLNPSSDEEPAPPPDAIADCDGLEHAAVEPARDFEMDSRAAGVSKCSDCRADRIGKSAAKKAGLRGRSELAYCQIRRLCGSRRVDSTGYSLLVAGRI